MNYKFYFKKTPTLPLAEGSTGQFDNFDFDKCIKDNFGEYGKATLRQMKEVLPERVFKEFCKRQNIIHYSDDGFVMKMKGKNGSN